MDCKAIIRKYLEDNKYDGLYSVEGDACGCLLSDFMPCGGEFINNCMPGYKKDGCSDDCGMGCDWHIARNK